MSLKKPAKKILVSGIQSSGQLHLGNYFGAIKQMVELVNSDQYESYIFLADYHSLTSLTDAKERKKNTYEALAIYLACGIDPKKANIFKQSDVPRVTELTWILDTVTPLPMLFLAHAFKDKAGQSNEEKINFEKLKNINAGLFNYPVLMASDILIYGGEIVPVGIDQEQHLEYAREIAKKYNYAYQTKTLKTPFSYTKKSTGLVPGIDGQKMSKSLGNTIPILAPVEEIKKRVMSIKTDNLRPDEAKDPEKNNIYKIHKLFLSETEAKKLGERFKNSDQVPYSYKEAKEDLLETILNYFSPSQKKYDYYTKTLKGKRELEKIARAGAKKANERALQTLQQVRNETGLTF